VADLSRIARAFEYLRAIVIVWDDGKWNKKAKPVAEFAIAHGKATRRREICSRLPDLPATRRSRRSMIDDEYEIGLPRDWYPEYATRVRRKMLQLKLL